VSINGSKFAANQGVGKFVTDFYAEFYVWVKFETTH